MASTSWWSRFPFVAVFHLTAARSDHYPVLLKLTEPRQGTGERTERSFRYEKMWETHEKFEEFMKQMWSEKKPSLSMADLHAKLISMFVDLIAWNKGIR